MASSRSPRRATRRSRPGPYVPKRRAEKPPPVAAGRHRAVKTPAGARRTLVGASVVTALVVAFPFAWARDDTSQASDEATAAAAPRASVADEVAPTEVDRRLGGQVSRSGARRPTEEQTPQESAVREQAASERPTPQRERLPAWLRSCRTEAQGPTGANGQIADANLCELPEGGFHLRGDAARAWWRLSARYEREFGEPPCLTDAYRSLASQQRLYASKPGLAARPGTSNHGWGVAVDLCGGVQSFGTREYEWLSVNAAKVGWTNPGWARRSGSRPEPWHWEFNGATPGS